MVLTEKPQEQAGIVTPEFIAERDIYYAPAPENTTIIGGCSDERPGTAESGLLIAQTYPESLPIAEGMVRVFGSKIGLAMAALTSALAAGSELPQSMNTIDKMMATIDSRMEAQHLIALNHSDATQEADPAHLHTKGNAPMGCAFANLVGATADLLVNNHVIREAAIHQQQWLYGEDNHTEALLAAETTLLQTATDNKGGSFAITRANYVQDTRPTLILAGPPHTAISKTGLIINATKDIASSTAANRDGKDFYSIDVVLAASKLIDMLPELHLDPQLVFESLTFQAVPVRAALELQDSEHQGSDTDLNPTRLRIGVRGNIQQAIADLRSA